MDEKKNKGAIEKVKSPSHLQFAIVDLRLFKSL